MMENTETELVRAEIISTDVLYQQEKAAIDIQIATAQAFPRNPMAAMNDAIAIVSMDKETAEICRYALPRGGKKISGPSINLAKILAQNWGNLRMQARVIDIDRTHVTSQATCFDLQKNIAIQVEVKRSIMQNETVWRDGKSIRTGKMIRMNDDMITVTGNATNSIALRNAIFAVIPRQITDKVYNAANAVIVGDVSDEQKLGAKRKQVFDKLMGQFNVTEAEILGAIGKASINYIDAEDIADLIGIGTAIREGDTTVDEAFRKAKNGKENVSGDILTKPETQTPSSETPPAPGETENKDDETKPPITEPVTAKVSDELRARIMGMPAKTAADEKRFIEYVNGLDHLHSVKEFKMLVLEKIDTFAADRRNDISSKVKA